MILFYILMTVYIVAVNFYGYRYLRLQRDAREEGKFLGDGKLLLAAFLGGSFAIWASMFAMKYRTESLILMVGLPILAVFNIYCFYLAYRGIWMAV